MNRFLRCAKTPPLALATILALGILLPWAFVSIVGPQFVTAFFATPMPNESLALTRDGEPYVHWSDPENGTNLYRSLEGQPLDPAVFKPSSDAPERGAPEKVYLGAADHRASHARQPVDWSQRIVGFRDHSSPPTYWYLLHDAEPMESAYFVGYDSRSKLPIGYIGRAGFRPDVPPVEDQFPAVAAHDGRRQYGAYGREPDRHQEGEGLVYFVSSDRLLGVDVTRRTVREIPLPERVLALAEYQATLQSAEGTSTAKRTVARMACEIAILDGQGKIISQQPIPKPLTDKAFYLYFCSKEVVFDTGTWPAATELHELYWVNAKGEITRQSEVRLLGPGIAASERQMAWNAAGVLPAPALLGLGTLVLSPLNYVVQGKSPNFLAGVARSLDEVWPPLVTLCAVGAILALAVYRRHRRISARDASAWATFVFLAGVPGILAYWLHRRWPAREKCPKCGALAPRDRDECLACAEPFPLPALVGIEIFA